MPLALGCNYSIPLLQLLSQGEAQVDWIKLSRPDTLEEDLAAARPLRPVLLHILGRAGRRPEEWNGFPWDAANRWLAAAGSSHIALHLDLLTDDWDGPFGRPHESRAEALALLARLAEGVRTAQRHLQIPLLVENMPYYGPSSQRPRLTIEPAAIWQIVEETGAGLLLDTAHLRCAAYHLGVSARAYAQALPLAAVREVHLSGPRLVEGQGLRDRHYVLEAEDYTLLEWLLGRARPAIVTLEYGGTGPAFERPERNDPRALKEQLRRLRGLVD